MEWFLCIAISMYAILLSTLASVVSDIFNYRQVSNIRRTKSQHLKDSRTVVRLSLPNPLKPDVKSRQLHLSDWQFYCLLRCVLYPRFYGTLSDWLMSCQPGHHAVVTVCDRDWKHKWAAYKSFDETSSFDNLQLLFLRNRSLQILHQYVMCLPRGIWEISMGFSL